MFGRTRSVLDAAGSRFQLTGRFGSAEVALPLLGDFNVANALAAAATALGLGRPLSEVARPAVDRPPGARPHGADSATRRASCSGTTPIRRTRWSAR